MQGARKTWPPIPVHQVFPVLPCLRLRMQLRASSVAGQEFIGLGRIEARPGKGKERGNASPKGSDPTI